MEMTHVIEYLKIGLFLILAVGILGGFLLSITIQLTNIFNHKGANITAGKTKKRYCLNSVAFAHILG